MMIMGRGVTPNRITLSFTGTINVSREQSNTQPQTFLNWLYLNKGWSIFHVFSKVVGAKVHLGKQFYLCHASHLIPDDDVELPQPEGQTQLNLDDGILHVGKTLLCSKEGHTVYVKIESINLGSDGVLRFTVKPIDGNSFACQPKSLSGVLTLLILVGYLPLFQKRRALLLTYQMKQLKC